MSMAYREEDSILDQKYEKPIFWNLYYGDFRIKNDWRKCTFKEIQQINTKSHEIVF